MAQIMIAPGKYVQGPNELSNIESYVSTLGKTALCLITDSGMKRHKDVIDSSFLNSSTSIVYEIFNRECSMTEINRLVELCKKNNIEVIVGVGGGKIFDTVKAVAYYLDMPVVIVPTIASTDAPCSALSVIYTDDGIFDKYLFLKQNPDIVLIDTEVVAKAPTRLLVAGMGDALATYFEARACQLSNANNFASGTTPMAAQALAKLCYDTLLSEGYKAKLAADNNCSTKSLEKIIEANTLLSGIGFESGGIAAAHAIHNGLTVLPECHHMYHGEKVAFGTIVQLVLENASEEELSEVINFCIKVNLPVTLEDIGVKEITKEKIMAVAKASVSPDETIHNMPFRVTSEDVCSAILVANSLGHKYKQ